MNSSYGAAPEDEFSRISDFAQLSSTATIEELTAAIEAGDRYVISNAIFTLDQMIEAINTVLRALEVPKVDVSSITTAANQTEYTLPAAVVRGLLRRVYIQTNLTSGDYRWKEVHTWKLQYGATGVQDTLIVPQFSGGYLLKLEYITRHDHLYDADDTIDESINLHALAIHAAVAAINQRMTGEKLSKYMPVQYNRFQKEAVENPVIGAIIHEPTLFNVVNR